MTEARRVDLDAARAARAETLGPAPVVILEGREYELARELPMEAILVVADQMGDESRPPDPALVRAALEGIFGAHWAELRSKLSAHDAMYVLGHVLELYGTDLPEPSASASS